MPKLIVLVGPSGSGKSTYCKELQKDNNIAQWYRISQDEQGKEQHLYNFKESLKDGSHNIVIDRMNFDKKQRVRYLNPAKEAGYETEIIVLHENYDTCLKRTKERNDHPTIRDEQSARSALSTFFKYYERPTMDEADKVTFVYPLLKMQLNAVIVDIDGTMANIDHRLHFMDVKPRKNWQGFFGATESDSVNDWCREIVRAVKPDNIIVMCSGRPDSFKPQTEKWLAQNGIVYDNLFMRPRQDQRSDEIVKEIILDFEILTRFKPNFAIDDRPRVCRMWRSRGITTLQCQDKEF